MTALWPPLSQIRVELLGEAGTPASETPSIHHGAEPCSRPSAGDPAAPLIELTRRREAARTRFVGTPWGPGCVVVVGRKNLPHIGVLLDHHDVPNALWHGWVTSAEPDWSGFYDVLLEDDDGPSDPSVSVVQAWNRVRISARAQGSPVLACLSLDRLAAVRAVWAESLSPTKLDTESGIESAPGHVALRETPDGHMVLTGTPLGPRDPRLDHQALYRDLGQRLIEDAQAVASAPKNISSSSQAAPSWWTRLRSALRTDGLLRPAFALLALVVVAQQWMLWQGGGEDEVRFRGGTPPATEPPGLVVRWQPSTRIDEAQTLLKSLSAHPDIGILPDGRWYIEVNDPAAARARLAESGLAQSVEVPK